MAGLAESSGMPITFNCPCGKILSSRESDAGLKAICPSCGRRVIVPGQIQTEPDSKEQLRKAVLSVDSWMQGHQRGIWKVSIIVAMTFLVGLVGYQFWLRSKRHENAERNLTRFTPPVEVKLDPNADPELWHTSFDSFAVALKDSMERNELLEPKYSGQMVDWVVTFDDLLQGNSVYFREAEPLRHSDHGILVWATVLPSQVENAEKLVPGQRFRLTGKIGPVLRGRSAEYPLGNITVRPLECSIKFLEPETGKETPLAVEKPAAETPRPAETPSAKASPSIESTRPPSPAPVAEKLK
jgi:hypothetical protein